MATGRRAAWRPGAGPLGDRARPAWSDLLPSAVVAVLIASELAKDMAGEPLFRGVSFKLERRERLTLAGPNGVGKTTLLRMLAGDVGVDGGELVLQKGVRVALHDQRPPRDRGHSLRDYVLAGCAELVAIEGELARLEQAMADGAIDQATLGAYASAQAQLEHAGGYGWRERALGRLRQLGFATDDLDRRLATFSGGELTRASLARALAGEPDLLLLDEPTNHLDIASLEWLEQELVGLDAAMVLVAHDRWFLEAVGTAVLELHGGPPARSRFFPGSWHAWRHERAARELAAGRAQERQQAEIERLERFVARFRAGTRARQAKSRQRRLDAIQRLDDDGREGPVLGFAFKPPERSGRVVFELTGGRVEVGEAGGESRVGSGPGERGSRVLLEDAELWLERGEHVSLVGANGSGKTTLIETLVGRRELAAGKLLRGHNVTLGFLSQHADELDGDGTVLEATQRATGLTPNKARALLGTFLFSGERAERPLSGLSGGERRRLSLAILVHSGANVLVLDEPTNHLDIDGREALETALRAYQGALLLISHDRALLDAVGTRTIAIEGGALRSYAGGWAEYLREREQAGSGGGEDAAAVRGHTKIAGGGRKAARSRRASGAAGGRKAADGGRANGSAGGRSAQRAERDLEQRIAAAERELAAVEDELSDPAAWADAGRRERSTQRHADARRRVDELYEQLERSAG